MSRLKCSGFQVSGFGFNGSRYRLPVAGAWFLLLAIFFIDLTWGYSQITNPVQGILAGLAAGPIPEDLLSTKAIALYDPTLSAKELSETQTSFERTGVDAVIYYPLDMPMSNVDVQKAFSDYCAKREIKYFIFMMRKGSNFEFNFTAFNGSKTLISPGQSCWKLLGGSIAEVTMDIYRTALNNQKRLNMLVNPRPEYEIALRFIRGTRGEYYAVDLKIDKLAVYKTGNEEVDLALEEVFEANYPFQYQFFEPAVEEIEMRNKGFLFVLESLSTRGNAAMELLGYNMSKSGSAIASVSYPNGEMLLKTIDANEPIHKFYFKQLQNGNVYLGTRWDADTDWKQALLNQIKGLKKELRVN